MECVWCGRDITTTLKQDGDLLYHNGCYDAKQRVNGAKPVASRKKMKPRPLGAYYHAPDKPSAYYLQQLSDFKKRMKKRGIKI